MARVSRWRAGALPFPFIPPVWLPGSRLLTSLPVALIHSPILSPVALDCIAGVLPCGRVVVTPR